jgi:hypothetical protein
MGNPLLAMGIFAGAAPFAFALRGRNWAAPIVPGLLALNYVAAYFTTAPINETRGVALFVAFAIIVVGGCGWLLGAGVRLRRRRRDSR